MNINFAQVQGRFKLPYTGELSRKKTFTKMTIIEISRRKLLQMHTIDWILVTRVRDIRLQNFHE